MKRTMLVGRSGVGKTTLTQAMKGRKIAYHKTQYINNCDAIIDTPGEYAKNRAPARALILYSYEADIVGLLMSAIEDYSLYNPNIVSMAAGEVIGIVTQINQSEAGPDLATIWPELTGRKKMFYVSSVTDEGVGDILNHLREEGDTMPWEREGETDEASSDVGGRLYGELRGDGAVSGITDGGGGGGCGPPGQDCGRHHKDSNLRS